MSREVDRHGVQAVDDVALTDEEDRGIEQAIEQYRKGRTLDVARVRMIFDSLLSR